MLVNHLHLGRMLFPSLCILVSCWLAVVTDDLVCWFQGWCHSAELWWSMRADEVVVQFPGSILPLPCPVVWLWVLLCTSQLFRTLPHSHMQGKITVLEFGPHIFVYLLHAMYSSSGFQIWKSLFSSYRFMLMEIAQCQHMNGGQALGNSMVISGSRHFVLQPCTDLLWTWSLISILRCSNHLSYLAAAWE